MGRCRRHPHHAVVGVCAYCLNDRLLAILDEEDDEALMASGLHALSPNFAYKPSAASYMMSRRRGLQSHIQAGSPSNYANQMCRSHHHRSLSSSPRINVPPFDLAFAAEDASRKKRPSLWSILRRHKHESAGAMKKQRDAGGQLHAWSAPGHERSQRTGSRLKNQGPNRPAVPSKSSLSSAGRRDPSDSPWKGEFNSPVFSSPQFMASPSRVQGKHHFPSPVSSFMPASPLQPRRDGEKETAPSHARQSQNRCEGTAISNPHDESRRTSWISSFLSARNRRSKSISGSEAIMFSQPSHLYSAGASPNVPIRNRRRSSSFLNDDLKEGTDAGEFSKSKPFHSKVKSPNVHALGFKQLNKSGLQVPDIDCQPGNHLRSAAGSFHEELRNHTKGHGFVSNASLVTSLASPFRPNPESYMARSPRSKLSGFLSKRKKGTVSIDCGREVRVSPLPMLKVKRDSFSEESFDENRKQYLNTGHDQDGNLFNLSEVPYYDSLKVKQEVAAVKDSLNADKDALKSPRFMSLQSMKHLLKSPKLTPVKTLHRSGPGSEVDCGHPYEVSSRSSIWSKSFTKTLSPILGRKPRKKQDSVGSDCLLYSHGPDLHCGHWDARSRVKPLANHTSQELYVQKHYDQFNHSMSAEKDRLHEPHYKKRINKRDELLVRETHIFPVPDEKGPPQQYSFLSKDYSAFSFYFSPRRSGSINSVTRAPKRSPV